MFQLPVHPPPEALLVGQRPFTSYIFTAQGFLVLLSQSRGSQAPLGQRTAWAVGEERHLPYRSRFPWHQGTSPPESSSGPWPHIASHSWGQNNWGALFLPFLPELRARRSGVPACLSPRTPRLSHTRGKHQHGSSAASSLMPPLNFSGSCHSLTPYVSNEDQGPHPLGSQFPTCPESLLWPL